MWASQWGLNWGLPGEGQSASEVWSYEFVDKQNYWLLEWTIALEYCTSSEVHCRTSACMFELLKQHWISSVIPLPKWPLDSSLPSLLPTSPLTTIIGFFQLSVRLVFIRWLAVVYYILIWLKPSYPCLKLPYLILYKHLNFHQHFHQKSLLCPFLIAEAFIKYIYLVWYCYLLQNITLIS